MNNKVIEIKNLSYSYPDGTSALKNITMDILEGESIGLVGPNGAGKSSLLLHLNGILSGKSELFKILGRIVDKDNIRYIRSKVGLVFQDPDTQLFMPTVFEDVSFGPINLGMNDAEIKKSVNDALNAVDMLYAMNKLSHHLSLGEKKRISIATVLSMSPEILVLDEPTSNLDPKHRKDLINLINNLKHTKIIATHDLDLVKRCCSKTAVLNGGRLIAFASTEKILNNKQLLEDNYLS